MGLLVNCLFGIGSSTNWINDSNAFEFSLMRGGVSYRAVRLVFVTG
jgi:hypothetical protein